MIINVTNCVSATLYKTSHYVEQVDHFKYKNDYRYFLRIFVRTLHKLLQKAELKHGRFLLPIKEIY